MRLDLGIFFFKNNVVTPELSGLSNEGSQHMFTLRNKNKRAKRP